jgi:hypothetical protein
MPFSAGAVDFTTTTSPHALAAISSILSMRFAMTGTITAAIVCVRSFINATVQRCDYQHRMDIYTHVQRKIARDMGALNA